MTMTIPAAGASLLLHPHHAAAHLLLILLLATCAAAFYATSPAAALSTAAALRTNFITRPLSTIISLSQQQQSPHMVSNSSIGGYESLGLSDDLITVTKSMIWDSPTPVQQLSIPVILTKMAHQLHDVATDNNDDDEDDDISINSLWCEAPTGSGKTAAFALPILQLVLQHKKQHENQKQTAMGRTNNIQQRRRLGRISTLILCPTRELAAQTTDVLHQLVSHLPNNNNSNIDSKDKDNTIISIEVVHGGVPTEMQVTRFTERHNSGVGIDILVATPGRLLDILRPKRRKQQQQNAEMMLSSLERRINDALDGKSMNSNGLNRSGSERGGKKQREIGGREDRHSSTKGRITASSLSLNEIREMDLINAALDDSDGDDSESDGDCGGTTTIREMFRGLQYLVLDEADRLLGKAFMDEMDELFSLLSINKSSNSGSDAVNKNSRRQLKTMLFSATFPEQIEERVDRVLSRVSGGVGRPLRVSTTSYSSDGSALLPLVSSSSSSSSSDHITEGEMGESDSNHYLGHSSSDDVGDLEQRFLGKRRKNSNNDITPIQNTMPDSGPNIRHRVIRLNEGDRTQALRSLLEQQGHVDDVSGGDEENKVSNEWDRVLVFVATRYAAEHVARKLRRLGMSASELHGKLDQESREQRLKLFRSGKTRVLLATDLAARGIDIRGCDLVINYDLPKSVSDYTHRTGRTGRAGNSGVAISFVTGKSESHFEFLEKGITPNSTNVNQRQRIEREVLPNFAPDEEVWKMESAVATASVPGAVHSENGLEHDRTFGGIKGRRKSKKDKLREAAAAAEHQQL